MPQLVLKVGDRVFDQWASTICGELPDYRVLRWGAANDPAAVRYACVWQPEPGELRKLTQLKAIFSLAAGADHILVDPALPQDIPIIRITDPAFVAKMTEYVLAQTLWLHRDLHRYAVQQRDATWKPGFARLASERRVGVMGAGKIGQPVAQALARFGFDVSCWRHSERSVDGVCSFHGTKQLGDFLARCEILICLLPLTRHTRNIIDADLLSLLPRGASLINVGRGELIVEADLVASLDTGHLQAAVLDVFTTEPLPPEDPLWRHPKVVVTPHVASLIDPATGARALCREISLLDNGQQSHSVVSRQRGY